MDCTGVVCRISRNKSKVLSCQGNLFFGSTWKVTLKLFAMHNEKSKNIEFGDKNSSEIP